MSSGRGAPALAWVRDRGEFYLSLVSAPWPLTFYFCPVQILGPFSCCFRFPSVFFKLLPYKLKGSVSIYIHPVCITPFVCVLP